MLAQAAEVAYRGDVLARDLRPIAQQGGQCFHGGGLDGQPQPLVLDAIGAEQIGEDLCLQPVGADLPPEAADGELGRVPLGAVTRSPDGEPARLVAANSAGSSLANKKNVRRVRSWRVLLVIERALPDSVTEPAERAPFRRETSDATAVGRWA